jgi:DNA-binding CsgD family transcriptional regulator
VAGLERLASGLEAAGGRRLSLRGLDGRAVAELVADDRLPEARSALSAGVRVSEELGVRWALATHRVYLAYERFAAGEWDDALAELEVSITVAEEVGEIYSLVYAHGLLSRISLHRNDLHRAREAADAGDRYRAGWGRGHSMSWVAWPRALIYEAEGQGRQALSTMAALWDWCAGSGLVLELPAIGADLVRLALAAGEVPRARQAADAVAEVAARNDLAWMTGEALRCRGLAEHSVAGLVAEGLSNPQIGERLYISSRTVQTHLAHVFAKLDISTRAQLAAEVTRRRPVRRLV